MKIYHPDVYLPENLNLPKGCFALRHSHHARMEALIDGVELPSAILVEECKVFEVGMQEGRVAKLGLRLKYNKIYDLCLVIDTNKYPWKVITCWVNHRDDTHKSLCRNRYAFK